MAPVTTRINTSNVALSEGNNANITCSSSGEPYPTISWTLRDQSTRFDQTDITTERLILRVRNAQDELVPEFTSGSTLSTLHIVNAQYPADNGVYQCTGLNYHGGENFTHTEEIIVQVQGKLKDAMYKSAMSIVKHYSIPVPPVLDLTTDQLVVPAGDSLNLSCNVVSANPIPNMYTWTYVNDGLTLTETSNILILFPVTLDNVGTYRCEATNLAGTGMDSLSFHLAGQLQDIYFF